MIVYVCSPLRVVTKELADESTFDQNLNEVQVGPSKGKNSHGVGC